MGMFSKNPPQLFVRPSSNSGEPESVRKAADEVLAGDWQSVSDSGWPKAGSDREPVNPPQKRKGWF